MLDISNCAVSISPAARVKHHRNYLALQRREGLQIMYDDADTGIEVEIRQRPHAMFDPRWVKEFLDQDQFWQSRGTYVGIATLGGSHAFHVLAYLLDNADKILLAAQIGDGISIDVGDLDRAKAWIMTTKLWEAILARVKQAAGPDTAPWLSRSRKIR